MSRLRTILLAAAVATLPAVTGFLRSSTLAMPADTVPRFSEQLIWSDYTYPYGIAAADIDGDGDIDLTSADADSHDSLYWFENDGAGRFQRRFITRQEPHRLERHRVADMNGDNRPDVVIVENFFGDVKWYENPGTFTEGRLWKRHYVTRSGLLGAYDVDVADFNGDGLPDVAGSSWRLGNNFTVFYNPGAAAGGWKAQVVDTLPEDTRTVRAADFDGDGRPDLLGTSAAARIVLWYRNTGRLGAGAWERHVVDLTMGVQPIHGEPSDLDRDGDLDIVMALGGWGSDEGGGVVWYENLGLSEGRLQWRRHQVSDELPRGFEAVAGDLDGDGDLDLAATGYGSGQVAWFENSGDPRGRWTRHLLKTGWKAANQLLLADLDRDGRLDIAAVAERGSLEFRWWRNQGPAKGGPPATALDVSNQIQLFLDDELVESVDNLRRVLHRPQPAEVVLQADRPWEDGLMYDPVVIHENGRYRMWYRTNFYTTPAYTGYAESADGIHWSKPELGLVEFGGSRKNNLVWPVPGGKGRSISVFRDGNPAAPAAERYKAIGSEPIPGTWRRAALHALVSADGVNWRQYEIDPLIVAPEEDPQFDSHNIALWDEARQQYVIYARGWYRQGAPPPGSRHIREQADQADQYEVVELPSGEIRKFTRVRDIRRYTSKDFRTWSGPEYIDMGSAPLEHLYKNSAIPYFRRPDLILMFPKRFLPGRTVHPDYPRAYYPDFPKNWKLDGLSDVLFMFSRDGLRFDRRYREAFLRPGFDPKNWAPRAIQIGPTLVPTGPGEMSVYYMEHYYLPEVRIRRGVLRLDGFVSLQGSHGGGSLVTRPLRFQGSRLHLNYATSAGGGVRVEIQDQAGQPVPGFELEACPWIFGDEIERAVAWTGGAELSSLAGRTVRLKLEIRDGDLYSFRFE